LQNIQTD